MDDLLNLAPCGFLSFADDGNLTLINATLLEMLGYEEDELVGRPIGQLLNVGSRIFYQTHWFPLLRLHGAAEEIFLLLKPRSGEDIGFLVNAVRHSRAGVDSYDCVLMRVRERRKYEEELLRARKNAEEARAQVERQRLELQEANEQLEAQALELELQQKQLLEQTAELEMAGEQLWLTNESLLARSEEAERQRQRADQANHAKSNFLAVMSHELRTPLNAIGGYTQLLEMGIHGPVTEAQLDTLGRIARSQSHLLRLINDVLDLARIESGRVEYVVRDVAVGEIVAAVTPMIEPQLASKGVAFAVDLLPGLSVRADQEKVEQILINLLGNAIKFTPAGGHVRVEVTAAGDSMHDLLFSVHDTGIGIPAEKLEAVFQPFVRVEEKGPGGQEGSGLGLAISRDLARGMGGNLTAHSIPGEGSTFTLRLPRTPVSD